MRFEKISTTISKFTHIIHVADIHIRLTKRHDEYYEVFKKFYHDVDESPETSVVCVLGDVCHSKSDLSPECVQMVSEFLWNLAERRDTILISGNHDATLANKTRLDSLTPIVDSLNHSKIHYLKETKLYGIGNILFNNMSIFDDPEKFILGKNIPDLYRNQYEHIVALFHGPVDRSMTDTGFSISNPAILPPLFDWHDIALLGDIHKRQNMQEYDPDNHKPCIHYPGSMIQQNHGETLGRHGYTLWTLSDRSYTFKEIPNDYGFYTVDLNEGKILTNLDNLPKKTYLRLKCLDSIPSEVKAAEAKISTLTEIIETARLRVESEKDKKAKEALVCQNVKLEDITDVDYQGKLITEFLKNKLNFTDQTKIDEILLINRELNVEIKKDDFSRNLKWTPIKFEWDNMFVFGEGNVIDFTKLDGIYGIFGPNTCGKSSVFSALCFCLFDKWDRGFKAIVVRNTSKQSFRCKFEFEISGLRYFIEKIGTTTRSGNVRVEVKFWRVVDGVEQDLTDAQRRKTNDVIRDYIGTFEDFVFTTLSLQVQSKNNVSFIDLGNTDRKDLLVQFMGLHVFDRLYETAYAKGKDIAAKLKPHKEKNYIQELDNAEANLGLTKSAIRDYQDSEDDLSRQIREVNDQIVTETKKLILLDTNVPTDLPSLEKKRTDTFNLIESKTQKIQTDKIQLGSIKNTVDGLKSRIDEIVAEDLAKAHKIFQDIKDSINEKTREHDLKKINISHKLEKLDRLKEHKYDPNCKFCVENIFVKDARNTEKELELDYSEYEEIMEKISKLRERYEEYSWVGKAYEDYTKLLNQHSEEREKYSSLNTKILLAEKDVEKLTQSYQVLEEGVDLYHRNEISLQNNHKVNSQISNYKNALDRLSMNLRDVNKKLLELAGKQSLFESQVESITKILTEMMEMEEERELYDYYTQAVGRNGIPYQVICNIIPEITREINSILSQITDFVIEMESDDKNINAYVKYETKGRWPIEMTSGFERFVISVAIRVALSKISNLPRSNFLVIDEGFGVLDAHNIPSMYTLFTFLKSEFDFVIIISHLDSLKDMVDKHIEISQIGTFSKVTFE